MRGLWPEFTGSAFVGALRCAGLPRLDPLPRGAIPTVAGPPATAAGSLRQPSLVRFHDSTAARAVNAKMRFV